MAAVIGVVNELKLNQVAPSLEGGSAANATKHQDTPDMEDSFQRTGEKVRLYLLENVDEYRRLSEIRHKGWQSTDGDRYFENQRHQADEGTSKTIRVLNNLMRKIAQEMQNETHAFSIKRRQDNEKPMILDMCAAPGIYLEYALQRNPGAGALGFSLPREKGGHRLALRKGQDARIKFLDVTMLAADMGATDAEISRPDHPHASDFHHEAELATAGRAFDLVLCDGQVLRMHQPHRAPYREDREARRLTLTQLALGLEHLRPGGTMVVLLHKVEAWDTVVLLHTFTQFSTVRLFKPRACHAKRSSFYMVATDVQAGQAEALGAVERWKEDWRAATFETDEARWREIRGEIGAEIQDVDAFLRGFGPELARMGRAVWEIQADALERAPFMSR